MLMRIDQSGRDEAIARVDDIQIETRRFNGAPVNFADLLDPVAGQKHGLNPARFGGINESVFDQCQHRMYGTYGTYGTLALMIPIGPISPISPIRPISPISRISPTQSRTAKNSPSNKTVSG